MSQSSSRLACSRRRSSPPPTLTSFSPASLGEYPCAAPFFISSIALEPRHQAHHAARQQATEQPSSPACGPSGGPPAKNYMAKANFQFRQRNSYFIHTCWNSINCEETNVII
ncbi:hypothetical protein BRADI_2g28430v3 [Brachypodium distachyon]|uniref:Uncharacterized protein n=1 Tax=Brachypodium distachyon TaxID=15368 RepID=A0A2K2DB37_BRADI|nr:hypothetical protein BRADI_2g28430v3 [Brachypodium distachyon]